MKRTATLFFATGAAFALIGMVWGVVMAATQDHALSPAHAHLNLIGFVVMSLFGVFYALSPRAAASPLSRVHYLLTTAAVVILVPGIVMTLTGQGGAAAKIGSVLAILAMAQSLFMILRFGVGEEKDAAQRSW